MILFDNNGQVIEPPLLHCKEKGCREEVIGADHEGMKCFSHMLSETSIIHG